MIKLVSKKETKQAALIEAVPSDKEEEDSYQIPGGFVGKTEKAEGSPFHISKIAIKNFKSISDISVELPRVGILTGPNNCGKSTILQAITLGFECLTRNIDRTTGKIKKKGSAVQELSSVPVNHPRNLWHGNKWQEIHPEKRVERKPIEVRIDFTNNSYFVSHINFYFGFLNLNVSKYSDNFKNKDEINRLINSAPLLIPGIPGILKHETPLFPAVMSAYLNSGDYFRVLRNVLYHLREDSKMFSVIERAMSHHFKIDLGEIVFDKKLGLEIKVPYTEEDYELEIISAGSGLHQILQLVALLTWSKSSIILLDEPDSHLHTSLQKKLFLFLDDLSREFNLQLLISTHSRDFLASSPISSIIPVDITERSLKPMHSMEHLLTEFKRQGELSNLDIACLYNSKSCLFIEGPSDSDILITLAERLDSDIFSAEKQAIMFPYKGKDKVSSIPNLVEIFQSMIGTEIKWFVLRDRDNLAPEIVEKLTSKLEHSGITHYHIWDMYEIENYLLDQIPITRLLNYEGKDAVEEDVEKLIIECCKDTLSDITPTIIVENQNEYKRLFNDIENYQKKGAELAQKYIKYAYSSDESLKYVVSGKRAFSKLFNKLQEDYGVNIRTLDIAREIKKEEISGEVIQFFNNLGSALRY